MPIFQPQNVNAPEGRRQRLLQMLTRQRQEQGQKRVPVPGVKGAPGAFIGQPGRAMRGGVRGIPKVKQLQRLNMLPHIIAAMGGGQHAPLEQETSSLPGQAVGRPAEALPNDVPPLPEELPSGIEPVPIPEENPMLSPAPNAPAPEAAPLNPEIGDQVGRLIDLGGGHFYDPDLGAVVRRPIRGSDAGW